MSTMGERIRQSREKKGLLQAQLAKMIGVKSSGVISNWEKDINKPDGEKMISLCETLDISLSFLLDYYGPEKTPQMILSPDEQQLVTDYRSLNPQGQALVRQNIEVVVLSDKYKKSRDLSDMDKEA